ncbi:hypothetical protein GCM10022252_61860 [Streptosporangium oxazolinicum]|uniref:Uncharacterized protein n=1 Tax=Streptosporangium oxazolinicum TaxID=909287 RepID=A0ABP8BD88_9ACTN
MHARVTVLAPAETVIARINPAVGVVEAVDSHTSVLVTGADALETIAIYLSMLMMDFRVDGPRTHRPHPHPRPSRHRSPRRVGRRWLGLPFCK